MKLFRRILFWTHLVGGLLAAMLILLMSVTGVLLTYEKQMIAWADREFRLPAVPANASRLPLGALVAKATEAGKPAPSGIVVERDPAMPVALQYGRNPLVYMDPYSGVVLGEGRQEMRAFMSSMREWHRWMAVSGEGRADARAITGAANVVFLFLVITGMYLWWPRSLTWNHLRPVLWFRGGLRGKARDFNWHNAAGFWCAIPLFFVVFSAVFISYPWASKWLVETFDGPSTPVAGGPGPARPATGQSGDALKAWPPGLDGGFVHATNRMADWRTITVALPRAAGEPLGFSIARGTGGQPQHRGTLNVAQESGEVIGWEPFESMSAGRRARLWMRFVHTGEYYGVLGQTIAGIASAGGVLLVYTGVALSVRRFLAWRARRRRPGNVETNLAEAA